MRNRWTAVAAAALAAAGCGGPPYPVEGTVTLGGKPVSGASVVFEPDGPGQGSVSVTTDPDGRFRMDTAGGAGAMPGTYRVVVTKFEGPPVPSRMPPNLSPAEQARWRQTVVTALKSQKSVVPWVYGTAADTPLRCTVPVTGPLVLDLDPSKFADKPFVHPMLTAYR